MAPDVEKSHAEIAYEAIAPVYDEFTAHHDYEGLTEELLPALEGHGLEAGSLLDVGCGTGKSFLPMLERGWEVTGCDISTAMVNLAKAKVGNSAQLVVADMRHLPVFGEFELVWAIDDTVNYLLSIDELRAALAGMRGNLAAGGLLMFDVITLTAYRSFFVETQVVEREGLRLTWKGLASADQQAGSIWVAQFEAKGAKQGDAVELHRHYQRHFPEQDVLRALSSAGLECLDVFGQHTSGVGLRQPLDEARHTTAVYIARRRIG